MSCFRYPGGKTKLQSVIVAELSKYNLEEYREPFFGGGGIGINFVSNNKRIKKIWINDKDVGLSCLWTSIIKYRYELKEYINSFIPSVDMFYKFKDELLNINKLPVETKNIINIGFKKLAIHQISYSGLGTKSGGPLGGVSQKSKYKIDCRWSPKNICKKIDKVNSQLCSLEIHENSCSNLDFADVINDDTKKSLIYLDPPYFEKGNDLYQCGFTVTDHERLAGTLKKSSHAWLLSYDDCEEIRNLYDWANITSLDVNYSINAIKDRETGERFSTIKKELLISNGLIK